MKIKAISIDDEPRAHVVIRHHASKMEDLDLIESFTSPVKALEFIRKEKPDLLFLDINMPDLDGITLLRTLKDPPVTIFTTAYDEYAVESYEVEAIGYLLKPIEFPKFYQAVQRAVTQIGLLKQPGSAKTDAKRSDFLFLKSGSKTIKIDPEQITYIQASGNYTELFIGDEKLLVDHTLSEMEELISDTTFLRIHRSYLVNIHYVTEYENHQVSVSGTPLPVGKTYRASVKQFFVSK